MSRKQHSEESQTFCWAPDCPKTATYLYNGKDLCPQHYFWSDLGLIQKEKEKK